MNRWIAQALASACSLTLVIPLALPRPAVGQSSPPEAAFATLRTAEVVARPSAAATVEDLAWIAGHWRGHSDALGGTAEEGWFAPSGGAMAGVFRLVSEGRARVFELVLIEEEPAEIFLRFKHVGPGWNAWEETALEYRLAELGEETATFESTADAPLPRAPRRLTYRKDGPDTLVAQIVGWGEADPGFELRLQRVP